MQTLTTTPTVADLVLSRQNAPKTRALHLAAPGMEGLLLAALSRSVAPGVRVLRREVVVTPRGRFHLPLVLAGPDRRIAILADDACHASASEDAASILVFGVFDVVYRIRRQALLCSVPRVAWEIARGESTLFDAESRAALRLSALPDPLRARTPISHHAQGQPATGSGFPPDVRVMRLKYPADWADAFERAMRSVEAERSPLFARSA